MRYGITNPWYSIIYKINCQLHRAHKRKDWPIVLNLIAQLDFIDPPQGRYARRYSHPLSGLLKWNEQ